MKIAIRPMTLADLDSVYDIETQGHITPWSKQILRDCIKVGYACFVLEETNKSRIRAFAINRVSGGECHLLNLCVLPKTQGRGYGKKLLRFVLEYARQYCFQVILEVRPTNTRAITLYKKHRFKQIGTKEDYYKDANGNEDAIVLALKF